MGANELQAKADVAKRELIHKLRRTLHEYHEDGGHGWLKVSKVIINALGIASEISGYSYEYNGQVYLEEDLDAAIYLKAIFPEGIISETFSQFWQLYVTSINDGDSSNIRSFPHYV